MSKLASGFLMIAALAAFAALALGADAPRIVTLEPDLGSQPTVVLAGKTARSLKLEFRLPALEVSDVEVGGEAYLSLAIPDGGFRGDDGQASIPTYTQLVAVPGGMTVSARVIGKSERELGSYSLPPQQPVVAASERSVTATKDESYYSRTAWDETPAVVVGAPAVLRDIVVVPVTFQPVRYRPSSGEVTVATSVTAELTLTASAEAPADPPRRPVPASFARLYGDLALDYLPTAGEVPQGSYLMIIPNDTAVIDSVGALLNWRRQQGYNVVLATTAQTGTTTTSIKAYIQNAYNTFDPPLEFVTLVGDATGSVAIPTYFEGLSGYTGEGDHYYSNLAGSDVLPDVHIGRLSVTSSTQLATVCRKIVVYESQPPMGDDPGWFKRASLTGDPFSQSGITTVFTSQWAKNQLLKKGYTQIDTVFSGNFASQMITNLNRGCTFFTYRGYLGMSGFTSTSATNSTNGKELPFAVIMTCGTGSFSDETNCRSEAFLRAVNGGGVASIGTATIGTHTRYNNVIFGGVIHGALNINDHRTGPALTRGKLELYRNYSMSQLNQVEIWSVWNSLMGDPATEIWTSFPGEMSVSHAAQLPPGASSVLVTVTSGSQPLAGAHVGLYKSGEVSEVGVTGADGTVNLPLGTVTAGTLQITVTEHDSKPYLGSLTLGATTAYVGLTDQMVDDDGLGLSSGNGDGLVNPAETFEIALEVTNLGTSSATAVATILQVDDPWVTVVDGEASFGELAAGEAAWTDAPLVLSLAPGAPHGCTVRCDVRVTSGAQSWTSLLLLPVVAPDFVKTAHTFSGGTLDPGESGTLAVTLRNDGGAAITAGAATLLSDSPWVTVTDPSGAYGAIAVGGSGTNSGDTFGIEVAPECFRGHLAAMRLVVESASGAEDTVGFAISVGSSGSADPLGPDRYGYYAFDNTDVSYSDAPTYAWVEIDPTLGGSGTSVGLGDFGWEQDDVEVVDLPFTFRYYGRDYTRASICSNGWVAMGATYLKDYRNLTLPSDGSPDALICGFWDDLYQVSGTGGIFRQYDAVNHRYIVEWSRVRSDYSNAVETFEIILLDPAHHPTDTGDGIILMQYATVNNTDATNGYATVGIQNHDRTDALLYTYWNRYGGGAATLAAGRAIKFTPFDLPTPGYLEGDVTNVTGGGTPVDGVSIKVVESSLVFSTAAGGHYFGALDAGTYTVVAQHPSFLPDTTYAVPIVEGATTVRDFQLVDVGGPDFTATTSHGNTTNTTGPYAIESIITDFSGIAALHFYYTTSADGGLPHELPLVLVDPDAHLYRAEIPGQPMGARVQYWLTGIDIADNTSSDPPGAPWTLYAFQITTETTIFVDDMESDHGWTSGAAGDNATAGLWTRVDPNGIYNSSIEVQPENDATPTPGVMCWITGNDAPGSPQGTNDVDGGRTTLLSPVFDLSTYEGAQVSYRRWFTNDTGPTPGQDFWRVDVSNDGVNWISLEVTNASDRSWLQRTFQVGDYVALTSSVRFRFIAEDLTPDSVVEAGVDEFLLTGYLGHFDTAAPTVTLLAPTGGEQIQSGSDYTITWTGSDDLGIVKTAIVLSIDGGATYPDTLTSGVVPTSYVWSVPAIQSATCRIKVICWDAVQTSGSDASAADFTIRNITGVEMPDAPAVLTLAPNRPNPFNPATEIRFGLPSAQRVTLRIFDAAGRLVATLLAGEQTAGYHVVTWRGVDSRGARVASGAYFYRLETAQGVLTRKMLLLK